MSFAAGCGDESEPGKVAGPPPPPPLVIESGSFDVTAWVLFNGCDSATVYDGMYEIEIDGENFTMGKWSGEWNARTVTGIGESPYERTVLRDCTITTWTTVTVSFRSEDEFLGSIVFRYRLLGTCETRTECLSSWGIAGVRVAL